MWAFWYFLLGFVDNAQTQCFYSSWLLLSGLLSSCYISDLVPREAVEKWLKYLREELPAVAFKCSTQEQRSNLGWKSAKKAAKTSNLLQTSDCLGAETLIRLLKNYSRSHEVFQ